MSDEPFDAEGFDAWLASDPEHKPLFDTMWQRVMGPQMNSALGALVQQRRSIRSVLAGGAVTLIALYSGYQLRPTMELFRAQPMEFTASDEALRTIRLPDGTQLTLAGGASVRVRYTLHVREVELTRGTIFADVTHDEARPFRIDSGDARITDIGTRFEVSKKPSSLRVVVASGRVRFGSTAWFAKQLDLKADQAAILSETALNRTEDVSSGAIARWRSGWVEYRDTPMRQVVADLESVSPLPIEIASSSLADLKVSGRIRLTDPAGQIENLAIIHNFVVSRRDGAIILSSKVAP